MPGTKKKFVFQLIFAFSQLAFPLITYQYITKTIGPEGIGLVGYVEYASGFIISVAAFGIPFYGVREAAKLQDKPQQLQLIFQQLFSIHFALSCIGALLFLGLIAYSKPQIPVPLLMLGCANVLLHPFIAEWYMQGIEAFQFTTLRGIVLRSLGLVAIFLFVTSPKHYLHYYLIIIFIQLAVAITNLYKIGYRNIRIHLSGYMQHTRSLGYFFLTASVISVYVFFDVIILGWFADEKVVGYYTLAIKLVKLSLLLVLSLNTVLFPRISHLTASSDVAAIRSLIEKALNFMIILTLPISAGFYFLAPEIIRLIATDNFTASITLVEVLSTLPLVIGLSNLFVYHILVPFGKEKKLLTAAVAICSCSLLLHVTLTRLYLEKGTATATFLTELFMTILTGYLSYKTFAFSFPLKSLVQTMVALVPFGMLIPVGRYFFSHPAAIISFTTVLAGAFYMILQLVFFKNLIVREMVTSLRFTKITGIRHG